MKWNGRKHIPINANIINKNKKKFDFEEALKPLGQKQMPVWNSIIGVNTSPQAITPFDPSSIGGLAIWLDASDTSTLTLVGDRVQGWASKGLVPMTFSASTTARRPEYITTGGTGTFDAVKFNTASTPTNRSGLMTETISGFSSNFGWSAFYIGKQIGLNPILNTYGTVNEIFNLWNTQNTAVYGSSLTTLGNRTITDYLITGTTAQGIIYTYNPNSSGLSGFSIASPYLVQGFVEDYTNLSYNPNSPKTYNYITDKIRSTQTGYGLSTFSGKTWNKFGLISNARTGTEVVGLSQTLELYEVLFYNKVLTQSEFDDVLNYIDSKYSIPAPNYSANGKVSVNWIGKTGNTSDGNSISIQTPGGTTAWNSQYGEIDGTFLMNTNLESYWNLNDSVNIGFNYRMADSNGDVIFSAECGGDDIFYTFSAGTYTLSGQTNYNCPEPSPTPTPTETITPSPTPTMTPTPSAAPFDADAAAYLAAVLSAGGTGITPTVSAATNTLYTSLKSAGVYSKLIAFYPILGGVQNSHAVDGKTPGGSQTLTFAGSWTHTDKGMVPTVCNTSNYADTQYLPTSLNPNSNHMFGYFNGIGGCGGSTYDGAGPSPYFILGHPAFEFFSSDAVVSGVGTFTNYGALLGTRTASNVTKAFRSIDGGVWAQGSGTSTTAPSTYPSNSITIAKVNGSGFPSGERYAFFSFGDGLSDTEGTDYYNAVLAFQTSLSRNTNL